MAVSSFERRAGAVATLWRFVVWMVRADPIDTAVTVLARVLRGLFPPAVVWLVRKVFAEAVGVYGGTAPPSALFHWLLAWAALLAMSEIAISQAYPFSEMLRDRMEDAVQRELQRKAASLRLEVFEYPDFFDSLERARSAVSPGFFLGLLEPLLNLPGNVVTVVSLGVVVATWSPVLLLAVLSAAIPSPVIETVLSRSAFFLQRAQAPRLRLRNYIEGLLTSRVAAKEIRTYDIGGWLLERWESLYWSVANELYVFDRRRNIAAAILRSMSVVGLVGGVAVAAWSLASGGIDAAEFAAMLVALPSLQDAVLFILDTAGQDVAGKTVVLKDFFLCLDFGPEEPTGGEPFRWDPEHGEVTLEDVSFAYPHSNTPALQDINVVLRAGARVALVGENGAGKTTLVKVLTGLYRPTKGRVLWGGRDLSTLSSADVRDAQAAVFQDHVHYAFTLSRNIGYGRAEKVGDEGAIEYAARQGGADAVANGLRDGYNTLLTREFSGGTELSGGQWQRVAVSRGFMREAPVIVLDEPTASLDPRAEAEVFRRFTAMMKDRAALLVSHRLGLARLCDRVLVLKDGRVVEEGSHEELVALGGEYARMWATQAQWYVA